MSEEYIKKEEALDLLGEPITMSMCLSVDECTSKRGQREIDYALIKAIPAADVVERKMGEWVREDDLVDGEVWSRWRCSECGYVRTRGWEYTEAGRKPKARLCEMCGADMRGES